MWNTYVLPQVLFGLEVTPTPDSEICKLEQFQRDINNQLQYLATNTSNPAAFCQEFFH